MTGSHGKFVVRYFLVGAANTVLYSCLLWFFLKGNNFPYPVSIGFAFVLAMSFQYLANKYFTFGVTSASVVEVVRYIAAAAINYVVSVIVVWMCLDVLNTSTLSASFFSAFGAAFAGYFLSFFWVYRK
jgi:putative flippase GtrA